MPLKLGALHPIDTGRLERYVTSRRVRYAISAAYSTTLNPRNTEVEWYSPWNHSFSDLVDFDFDHGVLTVKQQHDIWLSKSTLDIYKLTPEAYEAPDSIGVRETANESADNSEEEALEDQPMPPPFSDIVPAAPAPAVVAPPSPQHPHLPMPPPLSDIVPVAPAPAVVAPPSPEHPHLPMPPPLSDIVPAAPAPPVVAPPTLPEHDDHETPAPAEDSNSSGAPSSRPKRQPKPKRVWPSGWIVSDSVRAVLHPGPSALSAEEELAAVKNALSRAEIADNPADATLGDASTATIASVPDKNGKDAFPDLIVCHTHALEMKSPKDNPTQTMLGRERRIGLKVVHQCFPVVMEIKGCPRRLVPDEQVQKDRAVTLLNEAEEDLWDYLCTCFARDLCAKSVVAVSAAGPYWRWIIVSRHQVNEDVLVPVLYSGNASRKHAAFMARFKKANIFALGSAASDEELNRLRDKGIIPILTDHFTYRSTLAANPPLPSKGKGKAA